jgi:hypothetical protein
MQSRGLALYALRLINFNGLNPSRWEELRAFYQSSDVLRRYQSESLMALHLPTCRLEEPRTANDVHVFGGYVLGCLGGSCSQ